jgi:hypothetical protein
MLNSSIASATFERRNYEAVRRGVAFTFDCKSKVAWTTKTVRGTRREPFAALAIYLWKVALKPEDPCVSAPFSVVECSLSSTLPIVVFWSPCLLCALACLAGCLPSPGLTLAQLPHKKKTESLSNPQASRLLLVRMFGIISRAITSAPDRSCPPAFYRIIPRLKAWWHFHHRRQLCRRPY